jgi:hypothetical protein
MTTTLAGVVGPNEAPVDDRQWLRSIDGDHAWRAGGAPVFTAADREHAGSGNFPLWESCSLRDAAFRRLFVDWENGAQNFPDLGDACTPDQASAAPAPGGSTCWYTDAGNGVKISGLAGGTLVDSLGSAFAIGRDCSLVAIPQACRFTDGGNGKPIAALRGDVLADSLNRAYAVSESCGLTPIPDPCWFADAGNGKRIAATRGVGALTDSLGRRYWVAWDCSLRS